MTGAMLAHCRLIATPNKTEHNMSTPEASVLGVSPFSRLFATTVRDTCDVYVEISHFSQ